MSVVEYVYMVIKLNNKLLCLKCFLVFQTYASLEPGCTYNFHLELDDCHFVAITTKKIQNSIVDI